MISESGCPAIADPGKDIVELAHKLNLHVIPLIGPSSILLALMASGLNGQNFAFNGYLPINNNDRNKEIKKYVQRIIKESQTQIFIETPYRNSKLFNDLLENCNNNIKLCIASDITGKNELIKTKTIKQWKSLKVEFSKTPTIFLIG